MKALLISADRDVEGGIVTCAARRGIELEIRRVPQNTTDAADAADVADVADAADATPPGTGYPDYSLILLDLRASSNIEELSRQTQHLITMAVDFDSGTVIQSMRSGAEDFLAIPVDELELEAAFDRWQETRSAGQLGAIEYHDENNVLHHYPIDRGREIRIGRERDNDIQISSQVISRYHAQITTTSDQLRLLDCDSRHGVFLNNKRIDGEATLRSGDIVRLGKLESTALIINYRPGPDMTVDHASVTVGSDANQQLKEISSLLDTFLLLNDALVVDDVLSLVLMKSLEFAHAERGVILLAEDGPFSDDPTAEGTGQHLDIALARNRDGTVPDASELLISQKIPEQVMRTGVGVIIEDLLSDGESSHFNTIDLGVRSAMCVPLRARVSSHPSDAAVLVGVLYLDSGNHSRPFSDNLLRALESLANEAAQAIINAKLYEVTQQKRLIDEEMKIARNIQENLLPDKGFSNDWTELHGSSEPSRAVGGDILDYYAIGEERLGLLVGDVSGKGVAAGIFSAMLDGHFLSMSTLEYPEAELARMSAELNKYLIMKSRDQKFVTFVFGVLDRKGCLIYVNAGHNPPVLIRSDGALSHLRTGGMLMGMLPEAEYEVGRVALESGDCLVLYSDGVTEARNNDGEFFGLERLEQVASEQRSSGAETIHDAILSSLANFAAGRPMADDVTLMVLKML